MNAYLLVLIVQYITVGALFAEVMIVFLKWKNTIHSYLFLACISSFISNLGYVFELKAKSEEAYIIALKLSYLGRVWIVFAFFLFAAKMCGIMIPKVLTGFLFLVHMGIYLSILTIGDNSLYYTDHHFLTDGEFPVFIHSNGNVHDLFMMLNFVLSILAIGWIIRSFCREKNRRSRQRFFMLILAFGVQICFFLMQVTGIVAISRFYDLTMPGALIGTFFMLVGMLKYDLMGAREIAKDFAIDRISEGIIAVGNDGRIQYYNEPAAMIYPQLDAFYSIKASLSKKNIKENGPKGLLKGISQHILTPYDILSLIREAVEKGESLTIDGHIYTPEENDLLYKAESYGKLYALVDDTEHYRYMEELKKQKEIADNANESKSRFLASMSHEIRTPINAVLGMDEMILRESGEQNIRTYAADIMSAGRTLLSLINDILDLSKVEEGRMEIIPVQYDLSSLIGDLVNMIRYRAEKKGLVLRVKADEHIPRFLLGDEIRIRQCVMNLLTNAVKYTEEGEVSFEISYEKEDEDRILLDFKVEDTGIGMKEEDMETLFSPYKRIDEKRNRSVEGTGLGMSITRQLLTLMGSRLCVQSEYGRGSVFSFSIEQPVVKWEELGDCSKRFDRFSAVSYEYHEMFHAPDACILVVDDTEMNLTVIQSLLKKTQIGIDTAVSGKDAVRLAHDKRYDVIFIDHMMPDMDGIETLKHIRQSESNKDVPAVALTANAVSGAREMYINSGFTDYLSKPVDGMKLEKLLLSRLPKEKVITADAGGEAFGENDRDPDEEKSTPEFIVKLKEMRILDEQAGLANCGSADGYMSVLSVFHKTARAKADEIDKLYKNGDIKTYTIKVHALKSSARIIGAKELSLLAQELEDAGKREDTSFIQSNTDRLLDMYRESAGRLAWLFTTDEDLKEISEEDLSEAYQTMIEIAGSMDYGLMESILKDMRKYDLPSEDRERIDQIEGMLTELDWDGMIKTAGEGIR